MTAFHLPPTNVLKHFDCDLQKFYCNVLAKELNVQNRRNSLKIRRALKEVVEAYKKEYGKDSSPSIRFDSPAKRCAYVLKHSPCFTSAVAGHFLQLIRSNSPLLHKCLIAGELNLCCLGGGPASDAVAVSKIISALHRPLWHQTKQSLKFKITVVDVNEDWEITARNVLDIMKGNDEFFGLEGMELKFQFCKADLTHPMETKVRDALRNADVVTMVFFLSAVNRCTDREESLRMVQKIMENMKNGAVMFFLDSAKSMNYNQMDEAAVSQGNMEQIYGPCLLRLSQIYPPKSLGHF
ncbi:25S rRNA like protein [Argiope bruennichi]|uniref:25S rRNA like protein n=1 Tax=Argiope bruennichi TaxID=94029 RepID=A0A8T0EPA9_ARGBR|nr:25S rRNA like protein [Argiope bruennichi]